MSIQSEISRIKTNITNALNAVASKGVTVPTGANSDDLAELISKIVVAEAETYKNLVPTSIDSSGNVYNGTGYKEGYRLNSSGTETALANAVCSGFIRYSGEVIRVYGTANGTIGASGNYVAMYNSSFTKTMVQGMNNLQSYGATWTSKDGKYMLTIDPSAVTNSDVKSALQNATYIRCGFASCTGKDFVVTLDEEIT